MSHQRRRAAFGARRRLHVDLGCDTLGATGNINR
jgi:hypothetical protein